MNRVIVGLFFGCLPLFWGACFAPDAAVAGYPQDGPERQQPLLTRGDSPADGTQNEGGFDDMKTDDLPLRCPCCHFNTLTERAAFEICPVCFWEDDGQDAHNADEVSGGPNGEISLTQAQGNYRALGAFSPDALPYVRAPRLEER